MIGRRKVATALILGAASAVVTGLAVSRSVAAPHHAKLSIAVTIADVQAIVKEVGGSEVDSFPLFKGCILRRDLLVDDASLNRLLKADAVVWTGFFGESSAIYASIERLPAARKDVLTQPQWIDVSRDATRVGIPTSSCEGYVEIQFMYGDPFFWLNPRNGAVIARNVADGLSRLRPDRRELFEANARTFSEGLDRDIGRWQEELRALTSLKVFSAQCGWQNLSQIGGPTLLTCRKTPGVLDPPESLAAQIKAQEIEIVILDPNTPPQYGEVLRAKTKAKVLIVPSSIADLPGPKSYSALFDNFIRVLGAAASNE